MFAIPNCSRSIGIQVLLAMAFGITEYLVSGSSIPANGSCDNLQSEMSCYFKGSEEPMDWNKAKQRCRSLNSTLPVIRNKNDQAAIAGYLGSDKNKFETWTAGKNTNNNWTWVNRKSPMDKVKVKLEESDGHHFSALNENFNFTAHVASQEWPYICLYQRAYCDSSADIVINMTDNCLRLINDNRTWYDARYQCLMNNGDLAVIGDVEFGFLKQLKLNQSYWIGLRKKSFRWSLINDVESNDEIIYANWDSNTYATEGECIFVMSSKDKWKAAGCDEQRTVVCQRGQGVTSPTVTTDASTETIHTFTQESTNGRSHSSTHQGLLFIAIGVGIIVVICIIVIVVFVLRTKNGNSEQSKLNDGYVRNNGDKLNTRISNAPVLYTSINEPVDASVDRSDDIRGVYADIAMLTPEQSEDGGINQQPGIVYASLDFNKDPTNMEPNQTIAHSTSSPTKVGPLGDIYAVPDAKGHAVTSPGDESPSHPVKVTPQGDVYAIPMKMSTSPTAKTPIAVVYANLQAASLDKEQVAEGNDETK